MNNREGKSNYRPDGPKPLTDEVLYNIASEINQFAVKCSYYLHDYLIQFPTRADRKDKAKWRLQKAGWAINQQCHDISRNLQDIIDKYKIPYPSGMNPYRLNYADDTVYLLESFDQFSDNDFGSADPYSDEGWAEDGATGSLDGMWAFNGGYVDVKDDGGELLFKVNPREGNPFEIEGGEAERLKSDIETNIRDGQDTAHAIWTAVVRSYGDRIGGSAVRKAMNESMARDSGRDMVGTMIGITEMEPVAYMYREDIFDMLEKVNERLLNRMFGRGSEPRDYETLCDFVLKHGKESSIKPLDERVSKTTEVKDGRMVIAEVADPRRGDTMYFVLKR